MHSLRIAGLTVALALATALSFAAVAHATVGTLHLSWGSCSPGPVNQTIAPGQTSTRLVAWLTGQSEPARSYEVWIAYGDAHDQVPDAWRFDAAGCQGGAFVSYDFLAPAALTKTCPSFALAGGPNSVASAAGGADFVSPTSGFPATNLRFATAAVLAQANAPDPAQAYFLVDIVIDESNGVNGPSSPSAGTCGGLEDGICFHVMKANYLPPNSTQVVPFIVPAGTTLSVNAPEGCLVVPVRPATWGRIKVQYHD